MQILCDTCNSISCVLNKEENDLDDDDFSVYNENNATYIMSLNSFDKIRYGEDSKAFIALDNLEQARKAFPEYRDAINIVDNEIRRIVDKWGSEKIESEVNNLNNTLDTLTKVSSFNAPLTTVEQVLAVAHPMQAAYFNVARKKADKLTAEIYSEEGNGTDRANAFKHIYWSAYATKMVGEDYARLFTHAHEFGWWNENVNDPEAMKMDLHNNQLGREIGKNTRMHDLEEAVLRSIIEGKAAVLINEKSTLYFPPQE